jgi:muramoyltetrapeptide carboxypeptidase LdcA involved in peptidoglycan recycling
MPTYPKKLQKGDKVAILSPSGGLPEIFPEVFELGLQRLEKVFGLVPVEYPTTRILNSSLEDRVRDLHQALKDSQIRAIICTIGGDDQIQLLKYLDPEIVKNNPKIFMGYSDATNLCQYFTQVGGFITYYGPAIMTQFGASGEMDSYTVNFLQKALFETGEVKIYPSDKYSENFLSWRKPENFDQIRPFLKPPEWEWYNFKENQIAGQTWGGSLEILDFQLRVSKFLPQDAYFEDKILYLETSEERPSSDYVYRVLISMGERGLLAKFKAVLVARPKVIETGEELDLEKIESYRLAQKEVIIKAFSQYVPKTPILFNLDFGHTDPIFVIPNGGNCRIDGKNRKLFLEY